MASKFFSGIKSTVKTAFKKAPKSSFGELRHAYKAGKVMGASKKQVREKLKKVVSQERGQRRQIRSARKKVALATVGGATLAGGATAGGVYAYNNRKENRKENRAGKSVRRR